jgi:AAHS family 4-hydroxybenzoate transporter-like MFS transporter
MADSAEGKTPLAELIDRRPMSAAQIAVTALCAGALFVDGYDIQVMALAVPALAREWSLPPSSFGLALSGVVIGISAGSVLLGPLADRFGRRTLLAAAMILIGLATAGTALASTPGQFVFWRLLTGAALGAGIPSCAALTSEYAPLARRSLVMAVMNSAVGVGAFSAGFIAPPILDLFGWRGTFVIGGLVPLAVALLVLLLAPESLKFLIARRPADPRILRILARIAPGVDPASVSLEPQGPTPRTSVITLLGPVFRARSLWLWALVGLNLFDLYVLISWLPTLLQQSGWKLADALRGAVLIQAGGVVGGLYMARYLDRGATRAVLVVGFLLSAACLGLFAVLPSGRAWVALLLLLGAGVSGSQLQLNALSAAFYPPAIKATGVAWAVMIGGIGSIVAPMAGAWLLDLKLEPIMILGLLAVPSLICAAGVAVMKPEWQAH